MPCHDLLIRRSSNAIAFDAVVSVYAPKAGRLRGSARACRIHEDGNVHVDVHRRPLSAQSSRCHRVLVIAQLSGLLSCRLG
jgi:hypothetical protein